MTTVGNPHGAAHAKAAFGEIEAVANDAADTVKRHPFDELDIDAALQDEILDQPAHVVVGEGGGNRGLEAETTAQSARDVVFAAAFPDFEFTGATDAAFARVEPEHDFSERNHVEFARAGGFDVQSSHDQSFRSMV